MEFRTPIKITPSKSISIDHNAKILTAGSCFANVIGQKLQRNKFDTLVNPFGTIFNPLSIFKLLNGSAEDKNLFKASYIQTQGIWYNFDFHSDFSSSRKEYLEKKISDIISSVNSSIKKTNIIILTFGTSFVYKLNLTGETVANCHKVPSFNFEKILLTPHDIVKGFESLYLSIKYINPEIKFILTVSPVRHIKDGVEENSLSKAILRVATHSICEKFEDAEYFPSYEILIDDLRDYRFYKEDMIHPTEVAENYIWEKFSEKYIPEKSQKAIKDWELILKALEHRPFHPESEAHQKFIRETIHKTKELGKIINVNKELKELERRLIKSTK